MQDLDPSDICKKNFLNPLKRIRVIIRTPTHGRTDRQTDGRTDGRTDEQGESSIPPLNFVSGGIKICMRYWDFTTLYMQNTILTHPFCRFYLGQEFQYDQHYSSTSKSTQHITEKMQDWSPMVSYFLPHENLPRSRTTRHMANTFVLMNWFLISIYF